jgi:hypothetical protein
MIGQRFPEALNQGHATLAQVLRGETIILAASLFMGFLGYTFTIVLLGLTTAFVKRIPFRVMHKASMLVGIGAAALTELYRIPFFLHRASDQTAITGICLGVGVLVADDRSCCSFGLAECLLSSITAHLRTRASHRPSRTSISLTTPERPATLPFDRFSPEAYLWNCPYQGCSAVGR